MALILGFSSVCPVLFGLFDDIHGYFYDCFLQGRTQTCNLLFSSNNWHGLRFHHSGGTMRDG